MYAVVNRHHWNVEQEDIRPQLWDEFVPKLKEMPGFIAVYSLAGTDDPTDALSLTFWESEAAARAYLTSAEARALDNWTVGTFRPAADRRVMRVLRSG